MTRNVTLVATRDRLESLAFKHGGTITATSTGFELVLPGVTYRWRRGAA